MRRRVCVQRVDADYLVICAGCQIFAVGRESDGVYGSGVIAHRSKLFRFVGVGRVSCVIDGFGRPYSYISIWKEERCLEQCSQLYIRNCSVLYTTNLLQPLPGAFHPARRRNCTLRNLSVHLYSNRFNKISENNPNSPPCKGIRTSMCQPYRLDYMHIAPNQSSMPVLKESWIRARL